MTPFIPFFVLFCHVVQKSDKDDLACLEKFVQSIEAASGHYGLGDHYRLFGAFLAAAQYHVERKGFGSRAHDEDRDFEQRIESYLSTLGLYSRQSLDGSFSREEGGQNGPQNTQPSEPGVVYPLQDISSQPPDLNWFTMDQQMLDLLNLPQE